MTQTRDASSPSSPSHVDRLIVHQFDPATPSPGGIDTCLRGISRYLPSRTTIAVAGVDNTALPGRTLGRWVRHELPGERIVWFLPVVRLDPADQQRLVPHSLRLVLGLIRYRRRLPDADAVQVHRMDSALALRALVRRPQLYFIHTQQGGLTGKTSDSFWRFLGGLHGTLERHVVRRAKAVVVFNEEYSTTVRTLNAQTRFSPTWFDPALVADGNTPRDPWKVLWVGRLETPKDPMLAIDAFVRLVESAPTAPWTLDLLGSGTLLDRVTARVAELSPDVSSRIRVHGRVSPQDVGALMVRAGVFLMTSHAGYEGYARVLVEAMACGLPAVVTHGSDTGGLVVADHTGYTCDRDVDELADALGRAVELDRDTVRASVADLSAPVLVRRLFAPDGATSDRAVSDRTGDTVAA